MSIQSHHVAIENFCQVLNYNFPLCSFFFINQCVQNIRKNISVISSQTILNKLIQGMQFPLQDKLPKSVGELVVQLDQTLQITNECLAGYVEFKRQSVQQIFDQFGNMDNEELGIGEEHDENLETKSSMDQNTIQTAEEHSEHFSQSLISSTQRSDTPEAFTSMKS